VANALQQLNAEMGRVVAEAQRSLVRISNGREGQGAGTIWGADGWVITNAHVVHRSSPKVTLPDGRTVSHFTRHAPGTRENPLDTEGVNAKARLLMAPVLGAEPTEEIIRRVNALEELDDARELRPYLTRRLHANNI